MKRYALAILVTSWLAAPAALAQDRGWYVGGSLGQGRADVGAGATGIPGVGVTSRDDRDTYYKLFAGYQLSRHFAAEAGYADFGKYGISLGRAAPAGSASANIHPTGWFLDGVASYPFA